MKNSIHIFSEKLTNIYMNDWLTESFPTHWKEQMLPQFPKKETIMKRKTIAQWVCTQLFQKCLKNYYLNKLMTICKVNSQSILQIFAKTTALKMLYWLWLKNRKLFWIKKLKVGTLFMDLSKTFNILDHSLLSAKLSVYSFDNNSLSFIRSYLTSRIQRCTIENHFSNWREIRTGVRQWHFPIRWKFKRL